MSEATMLGVFNSKVEAFVKALKSGDRTQILQLGYDLIGMALTQLANPNLIQSTREQYAKQAKAAMAHLAELSASVPAASPRQESEGGDPFYTPKDWFKDEVPDLSFSDIIGVQEVKDAFMVNVVAPLDSRFRAVYHRFRGTELGTQLLLYGPPGTGKTHIARCLAGEMKCKIAVVPASEILAGVVGVAEKNIRDVFDQASKLDRCIIFIDEIDALCSDRESEDSRYTKSVLTTLLTCMDGFFKDTKPGQLRIIIAATNLPWKLDSALKRGGRFENQIYVPLPDLAARKKFIENGLSKVPHAADVTVDLLASRLEGYSGADIKAILRQIADRPLKRAIVDLYKGKTLEADRERVLLSDCDEVIKNYINPINREMIYRFAAYDRGISFEELMKLLEPKTKS